MYSRSIDAARPWAILFTGILLAAALLAVSLYGYNKTFAQDSVIEYPENGKDPVATLTTDDPEGDSVTWTLAGEDDFTISTAGVLTFNASPDFENAQDANTDNTYELVVTATDSANNAETFDLHVKVTNEAETGKVVWSVDPDGTANAALDTAVNGGNPIVQFQVGATLAIAATGGVTDGDVSGATKDVTERRQWSRGLDKDGPWTAIRGQTSDSYTVTSDDIGMYIQVEAFYNVGTGREESASLASDYPVLASRSNNQAPKFSPTSVTMTISEGKKGITVGTPVTATDDVNNQLNYVLAGPDRGRFKIDAESGQITTIADLDYDEATDLGTDGETEDQCVARNSCSVTVTATDSAGLASSPAATVTIEITDVNEKPMFGAADRTVDSEANLPSAENAENATPTIATYTATDPEGRGLTYHLMGRDAAKFQLSNTRALSFRADPNFEKPTDANRDNVYEVTVRASDGSLHDDRMVTVTVTDAADAPTVSGPSSVDYVENGMGPVATFMADDPDGDTTTWEDLTGADSALFTISDKGVLTFNTAPDFENATDDGTNNTYDVTVTASDGANTDTHDVAVKVTNVAERGKVIWTVDADGTGGPDTPTIVQFQVGAVLMASVTDGDISGGTKTVDAARNLRWQWSKGASPIRNANTASYTVQSSDIGSRISVTAYYTVSAGSREESASLASGYPVLDTRSSNDAPEFSPAAVTREIAEGDKDRNVGARVTATDDINNALNYVLAGPDRGRFKIDRKTGQITTTADLDYDEATGLGTDGGSEDQCVARNSCSVTVTATDSAGDTSTLATVTIKITDVNEKPEFGAVDRTVGSEANLPSANNAENSSATIATYSATDPENLNVNLTLRGADAAMFTLDTNGALSFVKAPNFEMASDTNRDNTYEVTVRASDGTLHTDQMVRVTVTGVNEMPDISVVPASGLRISGSSSASVAEGDTAVATYTASGPDAASTRWSLSGADRGRFSISSGGALSFRTAPDYETPGSAAGTNTYSVTVTGTDSQRNSDSIDVTVTVTDDTTEPTTPTPGTLVERYDSNQSGRIDKDELADAILDYEINATIAKDDLAELILNYEIG